MNADLKLLIYIVFEYLIKNWIAIAAFIISLINLKRNSIKIDVDFFGSSNWVYGLIMDDGSSIINSEYGMVATNIRIINTSNFDIGYFDLRVYDPVNELELNYYKKLQLNTLSDSKGKDVIAMVGADEKTYSIDFPDSNHGIIKAHSMNSIDIVVSPEIETSEIFIMFKVTIRRSKLKKPKHGYINSPYKQFSETVQLEQSSKPDYEKFFGDQQTL